MQRHSGDATAYRCSAVRWHGQPRCYEGTGGAEAAVVSVDHIAEISQYAATAHLPVETGHDFLAYRHTSWQFHNYRAVHCACTISTTVAYGDVDLVSRVTAR